MKNREIVSCFHVMLKVRHRMCLVEIDTLRYTPLDVDEALSQGRSSFLHWHVDFLKS